MQRHQPNPTLGLERHRRRGPQPPGYASGMPSTARYTVPHTRVAGAGQGSDTSTDHSSGPYHTGRPDNVLLNGNGPNGNMWSFPTDRDSTGGDGNPQASMFYTKHVKWPASYVGTCTCSAIHAKWSYPRPSTGKYNPTVPEAVRLYTEYLQLLYATVSRHAAHTVACVEFYEKAPERTQDRTVGGGPTPRRMKEMTTQSSCQHPMAATSIPTPVPKPPPRRRTMPQPQWIGSTIWYG